MSIPLRALLVEDSEDDAFLLLRELQRGGFNVIHERVDTAEDMLAALNAQFWDIVFVDYSMPHFNGLEALALLQQHQRPEPLILISGTIGEEVAVEAMKAGAQDYLLKSNLTRLIPAVQRTLRETQEHQARQQAEMALKASEERFHRFAENAQDILYIYRVAEPRGLEYISPAIYHITGYTPEEFYKDPDLGAQIAHPEDLELLAKIPQNDSSNSELRLRYIHKEGRAIWIEHRNVLITDEAGRLIAVEGIARDITERIAAERALIASEEKFRQLAENLREVFWIHELDGDKTIYVSPAYEEIWGRTRQSLYQDGASFLEGVHPDDKARVTAAYQRSRQNGIFDEEYRILHPNGSVRWLWGRTFPITNEAGQIVRIAGIAEEITQRKQHERELEAIAAVSTAIRKAANLNELVPNVLDQLQSLMASKNAALAIHDVSTDECLIMCARGAWEDINGLRLASAVCPPARNIDTGELGFTQAFKTRLLSYSQGYLADQPVAGAPLISQGQVIGSIWVGNHPAQKEQAPPYSQEEISLLRSIADITASAIQREILNEQTAQRAREFSILYQAASEIASQQDPKQLLEIGLNYAIQLLNSPSGGIFLYDAGHDGLTLEYTLGKTKAIHGLHVTLGMDTVGEAAQTLKPVVTNHYSTHLGQSSARIRRPLPQGGDQRSPVIRRRTDRRHQHSRVFQKAILRKRRSHPVVTG